MYFLEGEGFFMTPQEGAVEITDKYHAELLKKQNMGYTISVDEAGYPILIKPNLKEISKYDAESKKFRLIEYTTGVIAPLQDAVDLDIATNKEKQQLTVWKTYRVLLNRIDTQADEIEWPVEPV